MGKNEKDAKNVAESGDQLQKEPDRGTQKMKEAKEIEENRNMSAGKLRGSIITTELAPREMDDAKRREGVSHTKEHGRSATEALPDEKDLVIRLPEAAVNSRPVQK